MNNEYLVSRVQHKDNLPFKLVRQVSCPGRRVEATDEEDTRHSDLFVAVGVVDDGERESRGRPQSNINDLFGLVWPNTPIWTSS